MISPDELLLHGGCLSGGMSGGPCPSADSWLYSYTRNRWEKIDSTSISPRLFSSMASLVSDGFRQSAVMFSGLEKDKTILKTDEEREDEVALYDSFAKRWVRKRVQVNIKKIIILIFLIANLPIRNLIMKTKFQKKI